MNARSTILTAVLAVVAAVGGYGLYRLGVMHGSQTATSASVSRIVARAPQKAGDIDPSTGKKVLYWHDPMVPGQKFDKPGKSPFMDMQLTPVYAGGDNDEGKVAISPRVQQNLGVRTAEVTKGRINPVVEAVGSVAYNERDVAVVQARSNGFIERLYVRAPLDRVGRGQPLAELYVPDWVAAQEEFLSAKRISAQPSAKGLDTIVEAARQRMRLAGMTEDQIRRVESTGTVQARTMLVAPIAGVVGELMAREGMTAMAGAPLYRINGLSTVWVNAEVPESLAMQVRPGAAVEARTAASPETFKGNVGAILPEINPATRTIKARIELANPRGQLVPGMFVTLNLAPVASKEVLLVPSEAVIQTGKRNVVIVAAGDGNFTAADVDVGLDRDGRIEIRKGVEAGQKVVVSGQFLVDSEASLKGALARMQAESASAGPGTVAKTHRAEGKVENISKDEITISHGPVASLQWGPMTMGFKLPHGGLPKGVEVGSNVTFEFGQSTEGPFEIKSIAPTGKTDKGAKP